jgi:hypothetical protein
MRWDGKLPYIEVPGIGQYGNGDLENYYQDPGIYGNFDNSLLLPPAQENIWGPLVLLTMFSGFLYTLYIYWLLRKKVDNNL